VLFRSVTMKDVVFRLGEDPRDPRRGPKLELGYRYKNKSDRWRERIIVDGNILHKINSKETVWTLEIMGGANVCVLTVMRPSCMRRREDTFMKVSVEEERIDPQTWDAFLLEERARSKVTHTCYLDFASPEKQFDRVTIGLYGKVCPMTVANFVALLTGEYKDEEGNVQQSAFHYKGTFLGACVGTKLLSAGDPKMQLKVATLSAEEMRKYADLFKEFGVVNANVGPVKRTWAPRYGEDFGLIDQDGDEMKYGDAIETDAISLKFLGQKFEELAARNSDVTMLFYRPEFDYGIDHKGGTFPAENFDIPHSRRGLLSMERGEESNIQGSKFMVTLEEFPHMDRRFSVFGEVLDGMQTIDELEEEHGDATGNGTLITVKIVDSGLLMSPKDQDDDDDAEDAKFAEVVA